MAHNISDYIIDRAALVVALVEKAFHRSEEELLNNWEEYTSFCPPWSDHMMKAAYVLAEPVKKQLRCYGFICMWMGSVRDGSVGAPEDRFIRYYAGEGKGRFGGWAAVWFLWTETYI